MSVTPARCCALQTVCTPLDMSAQRPLGRPPAASSGSPDLDSGEGRLLASHVPLRDNDCAIDPIVYNRHLPARRTLRAW
jgi:hypothetical protein